MMTEQSPNARVFNETKNPSGSSRRARRPHPARTARIVSTGLAATMTLGTMTALTLADTSAATESGTADDAVTYETLDAESALAVVETPTTQATLVETPTTIIVVQRIHIVSPVVVPAPSAAVPVPTAATVPITAQTFAPKPAVRRSAAAVKAKTRVKAKAKAKVRAPRPKVRVRKAKPVTRSS